METGKAKKKKRREKGKGGLFLANKREEGTVLRKRNTGTSANRCCGVKKKRRGEDFAGKKAGTPKRPEEKRLKN